MTIVFFVMLVVAGCAPEGKEASSSLEGPQRGALDLPPPVDYGWSDIQERDTLVALTTYNSTSYFVYRGTPMGYEYDLLRRFADDHDLALRMQVVRERDSLFHYLNEGRGDVVANRIVALAADSAALGFTLPLYSTPTVLVQREPGDTTAVPNSIDTTLDNAEGIGAPAADEPAEGVALLADTDSVRVRARLVTDPAGLAGEQVSLPDQSAFVTTLMELSDSLREPVEIVELDTIPAYETIIRLVASGQLQFTAAPHNIAALKESYFTNLYVRPILTEPLAVTWAVRKNAPVLQEALDTWIAENSESRFFADLYQTYYVDRRGYEERIASEYLSSETGRLSPYDSLFRAYAGEVDWDWLLLASQAYQESRFRPRARSWAGARGLMQLMPRTARAHDVRDAYNPEQNVRGAVRFIAWLQDYWADKVADEQERLKFVLASYNTGQGHVDDARRLTRKYGGDDEVWADVAYWLLQKSKRKYYTDPVVRYGYARGLEPVMYVAHILDRYEHYQAFVESGVTPSGVTAP